MKLKGKKLVMFIFGIALFSGVIAYASGNFAKYAHTAPSICPAFVNTFETINANAEIIIYIINCENVSLTVVKIEEYITPIVYNVDAIIIISNPNLYALKSNP